MNILLAERIRCLRKKRRLSQDEAASRLEISRPSYIKIEKGKKELTLSQLSVLANFLGVTLEELQFDTTMMSNNLSIPKFKQIILNCIKFGGGDRDGKITKTKLAKLVLFI